MSAVPKVPVILDGGLATLLEARGHTLDSILWSAELLRSNPAALCDAHLEYLVAGAEIISTASYQASRAGFHQLGVAAVQADRLIASSVQIARDACDRHAKEHPALPPRKVAASIGPYGAVLHDGSEYTGDYGVPAAILKMFHKPRLKLLDSAGADMLAVETIPSIDEAEVLAELLADCQTPAWVSFSCRDGQHISDGTEIEKAAAIFHALPVVFALGVNCTAPQHVESLVAKLATAVPEKQIVAYPNSGESYSADDNRWGGGGALSDFTTAAARWVSAGATHVGGCCRVGPAEIRALHRTLVQTTHEF
ncbi:MAG TPA: homocysteine S-methyltransferase [Woeseiaceae bacterium]|nr:homocysteine S-methyltransferase [Woeseiaceae bacterium]